MVLRSNQSQRAYRKHRRRPNKPACDFCALPGQQMLYETENLAVIDNLFPYAIWDFCRVRRHLLVVPKSHVESVDELTDEIRYEYFMVISRYEAQGYNFYGRGPGTRSKSIDHQHTHLIQTEAKFLNPIGIVWAYIGCDVRAVAAYPKQATLAMVERLQRASR